MVYYFEFTWAENKKYNSPIRKNLIRITSPISDVGINAHIATQIFCKNFGNLKKNKIIQIQEKDINGNDIGEKITPMEDSNIVPVSKK